MAQEKKVSVIMASYLGEFQNSATQREKKYIRAVKSFLNQSYPNKELIIVADGCTRTYEIYKENWENNPEVNCIIITKQPIYSGLVRTEGLREATGDIITYLDNDDVLGKTHIETIINQFTDDVDWVYYDDYLVMSADFKKLMKREVGPRYGSIGTSSISHRNLPQMKVTGLFSNGYGHDWIACMKLTSMGLRFKKLKNPPQYLVAHFGLVGQGGGDF
jgi:glycosyltransferase involved in cell wall biosynthesis